MRDTLYDLFAVLVAITGLAMTTLVLDACGSDDPATRESTESWTVSEPAGTEFPLTVWIGGCGTFDRLDVDETADVVTIDAIVVETEGSECATVMRDVSTTVTLDAPLGDRDLRGCLPADPDVDCQRSR